MRSQIIYIVLLLSVFVLQSCTNKSDAEIKIPDNILTEEQFTKVLVDFALAESAINLNIKNAPIPSIDTTYAFNPLKENNVSRQKYDSTILFYASHTDLYKKIYENVLAILSDMQVQRDSISVKKDLKPDTTAK